MIVMSRLSPPGRPKGASVAFVATDTGVGVDNRWGVEVVRGCLHGVGLVGAFGLGSPASDRYRSGSERSRSLR